MVQKCSDLTSINNLSKIINAYGNNPTAPIPKRLERGKSTHNSLMNSVNKNMDDNSPSTYL